ncbi:MAG: hypothetical protein AAF206_01615 [Bacteroidota bacterium]
MKLIHPVRLLILCLLPTLLLTVSACNESGCETVFQEFVGDEFFTVEYRDPDGNNYINSIYDLGNVVVFLDTAGGKDEVPQFERITPGYEDGKFGPFFYTERYVNQINNDLNQALLWENPFKFDYFFKKDSYGVDTLSVIFVLDVDQCRTSWGSIRYELNGNPLPEYDNQQQAEIVIVE